ncbi:MAG: alkaline phosphatase family protein [Thermoanaerobaculales bacterium]|nr:alkaline phosphatase family protein [Thermoanaerobaculales bacterium]
MVSYDSLPADLAWRWISDPTVASPDGLAGMARQGFSAERLRMVNPTLTAVNHISLAAGQNAAGTGIVSNAFHRPDTPITEWASGFNASSSTETLWTAARRNGLRVATLAWPGADAEAVDRLGDFGVVWPGPPLATSEIVDLDPATAETTGEVPSNDGLAPLLWRLRVDLREATPSDQEMLIALVDADPNGRPRYDAVAVRLADEDDWNYVSEMEWVAIDFEARAGDDLRSHLYGCWSKVLHIDPFTGTLRFYLGEINRLHAYPDAFEDRLTEAIGPWPGEPDRAVADWWLDLSQGIDLDTFIEQGERFNRYVDRMTEWVLAQEDADLILAYHSPLDVYLHASLITDELQWAYSPGRALAASEGLKRMGRSIDQSVASLWRLLEPERDALVVVSDHGQLPIFEIVRPNRALADAGLVKVIDEDGRTRVAPDTPMVAVTSGAFLHLYLNLAGREPGGVVTMAEAPELLRRAARVMADLEAEGRPAVEKIFTRGEAAAVGLDHPSSGDLVIFLAPGFAADGGLGGPALEPSRYYGQHGFMASHDEMCGVLFARGAGIKKKRFGEVASTSVAPMIARWLGFELGRGER